jgi:hypothetical protein
LGFDFSWGEGVIYVGLNGGIVAFDVILRDILHFIVSCVEYI